MASENIEYSRRLINYNLPWCLNHIRQNRSKTLACISLDLRQNLSRYQQKQNASVHDTERVHKLILLSGLIFNELN